MRGGEREKETDGKRGGKRARGTGRGRNSGWRY